MIPSAYFELVKEQSTFTKKIVRYTDNKSKLTMSYLTNISRDADVPGYIVKEAAGVDTTTNLKYEQEIGDKTWMVVPAEDEIDGKIVTVYYILSSDRYTAFWLKSEVVPDSNDEEYQAVVEKILSSYIMYYSGESVFDVPTTGYYAENPVESDGTISDTTEYKANDEDNNVYKTTVGFDEDADISYDWRDLEIIIDGQRLSLPCTMQDFYNAGFKLNDKKITSGEISIFPGASTTFEVINGKGTIVSLYALNDSNVSAKTIDECNIVRLSMDTSSFISITESNTDSVIYNGDSDDNEEDESNSNNDENSEEDDEESSDKDDKKTTSKTSSSSDITSDESPSDEDEEESSDDKKDYSDSDDSALHWTNSADSGLLDRSDASELSEDHTVILPCGVTLNIYTEDLIDTYGSNNTSVNEGNEKIITWKTDNKYMTIRAGVVQNIKYIELSAIDAD
jgi:hypothetical protein